MYFAILWKNPEISKAELQILQPTHISYPKKWIITFETEHPETIMTLWGIIKAGKIVKEKDLPEILENVVIIGIKEIANGKHLKNTIGVRRFKVVDFFHTDKEIKEKGLELINLWNGDYGIVEQYQNIALYETIDFDKPGRSMHMGMMPAKLTHIMINIWINSIIQHSTLSTQHLTIYDPFVGSWTTGFLANASGYDFIGSDIDIHYAQENLLRWQTTPHAKSELSFSLFQQDITKPILKFPTTTDNSPLIIVSEWRLGPIIHERSSQQQIFQAHKEVIQLYQHFLKRTKELFQNNNLKRVVVTIPHYSWIRNAIEEELSFTAQKLGLSLSSISEVYMREHQKVGRKILIIEAK
jgi:hypothetical protein